MNIRFGERQSADSLSQFESQNHTFRKREKSQKLSNIYMSFYERAPQKFKAHAIFQTFNIFQHIQTPANDRHEISSDNTKEKDS